MDVSSVGSLNTAIGQTQGSDAVSTLVLKKALELEKQNAAQLLQSLPATTNNPPNLGNNVDVKA